MDILSEYPNSPYELFKNWFLEAKNSEPSDPDAAALATVDGQGLPDVRVVLIRRIDPRGFCFFTNFESAKGQELTKNPRAAINFHWKSLKRQVRVRGTIAPVSAEEADEYYHSRPLGNRIGAWASRQSRPLADRAQLLDQTRQMEKKYGDSPPRPPYWSGFRLSPVSIEFWREGEYRLHHRVRYKAPENGQNSWDKELLYP